jgi:DNA-binding CsgD family transcriptional regulator
LAYSLGIATLIVQIISYLKDLEYKETIFFTIAFLLLIIASTFQSFLETSSPALFNLTEMLTNVLIVVFAISIPVNIHKERVDRHRKTRNSIVFTIGSVMVISIILLYHFNQPIFTIILVSLHLFLSVLYSMFFLLFSKPGPLIRAREKSERLIASIILVVMVSAFVLFVVNVEKFTLKQMQQNGGVVLAVICIVLAAGKIPGDIKRLVQSERIVTADENQLARLGITQREHEVILLLITGKTYKEIAAELFISLPTVKTHVSNIYSKANVRNRLELSNLIKKNPVSNN